MFDLVCEMKLDSGFTYFSSLSWGCVFLVSLRFPVVCYILMQILFVNSNLMVSSDEFFLCICSKLDLNVNSILRSVVFSVLASFLFPLILASICVCL